MSSPRAGARTLWCLVATSVAVATGAAIAGGSTTGTTHRLVIYSLATKEEFNNHSDDRTRGAANNPFGNFTQSKSVTREPGIGPFAGDRAVFVFKLYSDARLKKEIGTATLSCQYGFAKRGICQAEYLVDGGTLLGLGGIDFNSRTFDLAVTGGSGKYLDASGDLEATQVANRTNRLAFTLT